MELKRFDLFQKLTTESQRTTSEGGMITLVGLVVGFLLILSETLRSLQVTTLERLDLFQDDHADLTIQLEMTFFHLKCQDLALQVSTASSTDEQTTGGWSVRSVNTIPAFDGEGCDVKAQVDVARYESGEMHVALSPHVMPLGDVGFTLEEYFKFNSSHEIKSWSIGKHQFEEGSLNKINFGRKTVPAHGTGRFVYDFNVVPQSFWSKNTQNEQTSFLVQAREQDVITRDENEGLFALQRLGLPGVFMTVQLSTMMVVKVEASRSWNEFIISVLGIVAGTSAMVAFVDSVLHEALWKSKLD